MKVTAFHLASKVEEAARSYFSNSFVFSGRKIDVERTVDFRKGNAVIQFFLRDGEERVPMGGMEFATVQERDSKVAFQCRYSVLPAEVSEQFFMIMPSDAEQYAQYSRLTEMLRKHWEKNINSYLPKNEEAAAQAVEAPKSLEEDYESLSPEEIEAITGVKPEPRGAAPMKTAMAAQSGGPSSDAASVEEIQRLMGMMMGGAPAADAPNESADAGSGPAMTMEEIEALAREVHKGGGRTAEAAAAPKREPEKKVEQTAEAAEDAMSAEDIWKQINGGL